MPETHAVHAPTRTRWGCALLCALFLTILLALVLPAVSPVPFPFPRRHRAADVRTEVIRFEQALATFRAEFGRFPPSSVTLPEDGIAWNAVTRSKIRQLWPNFDFAQAYDLNRDGDINDTHSLTGAECLVFFLGGLRASDGTLSGFSKNPLRPFETSGLNRSGLFYDFDLDRLTDVDNDGLAEYGDTMTGAPYLYAATEYAATEGKRFQNEDLAVYGDDDSRNMQQVYSEEFLHGEHQIICAGEDGEYGIGGDWIDDDDWPRNREAERDNITSFSGGRYPDATYAELRPMLPVLLSPLAAFVLLFFVSQLIGIRRRACSPREFGE